MYRLSFGPPDLDGSAQARRSEFVRAEARGVRGAGEQGRGRGSETCALSNAAISSGAIQLQTRLNRKCDSDAHRFFWQSSANFAVLLRAKSSVKAGSQMISLDFLRQH